MPTKTSQPDAAFSQRGRQTPPPGRSWIWDMCFLGLVWCASLALVWPIGDFPLNDDWSFAGTVKRLLETGRFQPIQWAAMTLITQTYWGALFCLPAGFSFNALRISTLVMAGCGIATTYLCVRLAHPSRLLAVVAALTLMFNPIYYSLSITFMTDVTFCGLLTLSGLLLCRNLIAESRIAFAAGTACAVAATLCRQLGLAVPLAYGLYVLLSRRPNTRVLLQAAAPLGLCVAAMLALQHYLRVTGNLPEFYLTRNRAVFATMLDLKTLGPSLAKHAGIGALYLGWFALPITLLALPSKDGRRSGEASTSRAPETASNAEPTRPRRRAGLPLYAGIGFGLVCAVGLPLARLKMPTTGNILLEQGIGPLTLRDGYFAKKDAPIVPSLGKVFWLGITAVSVLGGGLLVAGAVSAAQYFWLARQNCLPSAASKSTEKKREGAPKFWSWPLLPELCPRETAGLFFLLCAAVYLFPVMTVGGWDRYYVPGLPFLLAGICALAPVDDSGARGGRAQRILSISTLALLAVLAVGGTHDYFAWNRARWTGLRELLASGTAGPRDVDGGFEFNGWYLYDPTYREGRGKSFWWVEEDTYQVTFAEKPGWKTVSEYSYAHWLPPYGGRIHVLEKQAPSSDGKRQP